VVIAYTIHKIHENILTLQNLWSTYDTICCLCLHCHRSPWNHRLEAPISMDQVRPLVLLRWKHINCCHLLFLLVFLKVITKFGLFVVFWHYSKTCLFKIKLNKIDLLMVDNGSCSAVDNGSCSDVDNESCSHVHL